jgi:thymidylate synthase (FAD)
LETTGLRHTKLISHSIRPDESSSNIEDLIAYCARVSNPSNQNNSKTAPRLIKYLMKHKHWSPFEMASVGIEIKTTRDIARQILRHRSFSFQEYSQRYADPTQDLSFVHREVRLQDPNNRQNSIEIEDDHLDLSWQHYQLNVRKAAKEAYAWAIENGIAKEVARSVLPEGLTESVLQMHGTVRSWLHYIEVRSDISTQKEHREIAEECAIILGQLMPKFMEIHNEKR